MKELRHIRRTRERRAARKAVRMEHFNQAQQLLRDWDLAARADKYGFRVYLDWARQQAHARREYDRLAQAYLPIV